MRLISVCLKDWPRTEGNEPIFKSTEDANFYANLISDTQAEIKIVRDSYKQRRKQVKTMRDKGSEDFNIMFHLACQGQFYRECLDEVDRIHNNKFTK